MLIIRKEFERNLEVSEDKSVKMFTDIGVGEDFHCHFNTACYGEICIDPKLCRKSYEELTHQERADIEKFNKIAQ